MKKNYIILTIGLVLILSVPAIAVAPRGFIGDTGSGWDASGTVSARASYVNASYPAVSTIDGSGIDVNGVLHDNVGVNMWKAWGMVPDPCNYTCNAEYCGKSRYSGACGYGTWGDGPGNSSTWIEYDLGSVVKLDEIWIWNYTEGDVGGYGWSSMGMQKVQIHVVAMPEVDSGCLSYNWGTSDTTAWTLVYDGNLPCYGPGDDRDALVIDINAIDANGLFVQYVVITAAPDHRAGGTGSSHDLNWTEEKRGGVWTDGSGLSEVRFYGNEMAPRCYIGDNGTDWDTSSAVSVRAGWDGHATSNASDTIDGSAVRPDRYE